MGLVEYSESEGSDTEDGTKLTPTPKQASSSTSKPTFQKVVDRSNPRKIRVNLPEISRAEADTHEVDGGKDLPSDRKLEEEVLSAASTPSSQRQSVHPKRVRLGLKQVKGQGEGLGAG
jgi:hypothetical protein